MRNTLVYALNLLFNFLEYAIIVDVILSWIMPGKDNQIIRTVHIFTDPFLEPARKLQNKFSSGLMLDFSPIIALAFIWVLRAVLFTVVGMFR